MLNKEKVLDDAARLAGSAAGVIGSVSQSIRAEVKTRVEEMSERLDLIPRSEYERLEARVEALEKLLKPTPVKKAATKKPTAKKAAPKKPTVKKPTAKKKK